MSDAVSPLPEGTLLAGKLRVLRLLGMGGMGAVYEVEHELTKHRRALKMLHPQFRAYPSVIARFLREASAAGRIGNPHIIETFDAGELDTGEPYLVMEFLQGEVLADLLGRKGRLDLPELVELMTQACDGVQAAHDSGIVHRDLKPENLFVLNKDGHPFIKILDFGVSKFDAELTGGMGMTKEGSTLGTPFYMPPEQVRGSKDLDARADVYALGVILYECASGKRPFEAETLPHLALLIHEGKPIPLSELRPDLPQGFVDVVLRAMSSDRDQRFPTARDLGQALSAFGASGDDALGATMAGDVGPRIVIPSASPPRTAASMVGATLPGSTVSVAEEKPAKPGSKIPMIAAAALVLVVGGGILATRGGPAPPPAPAATTPAAAAPPPVAMPAMPAIAAPTASASAAPVTQAVVAKPGTPATTHTGAVAKGDPPKTDPPKADPPKADPPPTPKPNTRVDQKGLAGDNPFK